MTLTISGFVSGCGEKIHMKLFFGIIRGIEIGQRRSSWRGRLRFNLDEWIGGFEALEQPKEVGPCVEQVVFRLEFGTDSNGFLRRGRW